jgi:hypothetical protein
LKILQRLMPIDRNRSNPLRGTARLPSVKARAKKEAESDASSANAEEDEHFKALEKNMKLQQTRVTFAMVAKYYMQWLLLIVVHGFVFWYFPT